MSFRRRSYPEGVQSFQFIAASWLGFKLAYEVFVCESFTARMLLALLLSVGFIHYLHILKAPYPI